METAPVKEALTWLEKSNAGLEPELLSADAARELLDDYARAEKLAAYGKTVLAQRIADAAAVARATGVSMGKAKVAVDAGEVLKDADQVRDAFKGGTISWTRPPRSPGPRTPVPAPPTTSWAWPTRSRSTCSGTRREVSSWRRSRTTVWRQSV